MTVKGYVLIEIRVGKTKEVVEAIRKLQGVISVDVVTGPYDVISVLQVESLNEIGDLITAKVYTIDGILRIVTCLALKSS